MLQPARRGNPAGWVLARRGGGGGLGWLEAFSSWGGVGWGRGLLRRRLDTLRSFHTIYFIGFTPFGREFIFSVWPEKTNQKRGHPFSALCRHPAGKVRAGLRGFSTAHPCTGEKHADIRVGVPSGMERCRCCAPTPIQPQASAAPQGPQRASGRRVRGHCVRGSAPSPYAPDAHLANPWPLCSGARWMAWPARRKRGMFFLLPTFFSLRASCPSPCPATLFKHVPDVFVSKQTKQFAGRPRAFRCAA